MRPSLLCYALTAALALACTRKAAVTAPSAAPHSAANPAPSGPELLVQPQPVWKQGAPTFNGTGFFLKAGTRLLMLTSAHYFGSEVDAVNVWSTRGEPLLQARYSLWGFDDQGVDGAIQDLSSDVLAVPVPRLPEGFMALESDPRHFIPAGERVWLPNKQSGSGGYQRVEGRVTEWDPGFIDVELDHPVSFSSQSGSPVLSVTTGKVVGVLSRVGGTKVIRLTPMWAIGTFMLWGDSADADQSLLGHVSLKKATVAEVTPTFDWPTAEWQLLSLDLGGSKPRVTKQMLVVRPAEGGVHVTSRGKDIPLFNFDITQGGKVMTEIVPTPEFHGVVKQNSPGASDADVDAYIADRAQDLLAMVGNFSVNWAGQTLKIGVDYERKIPVQINGVEGTVVETFQAHHVSRCERETYKRCVTLLVRRAYGAAEVARLQAELKLHNKPSGIADVRYLATIKFELDTMVPHLFVMHRVTYTEPARLVLRLDLIDHPEVPDTPEPQSGVSALRTQPRLPKKTATSRLAPTMPSGTPLASLRASAGPLVLHGPGPESKHVAPPPGAQEMIYSSGALQLRGWLAKPNAAAPLPMVVYLHDGFSPTPGDWAAATEYLKRGYAVFVPQLRGEAGNAGEYTAFLREVDDVVSAGSAAAGVPGVDPKRTYLVGRGTGGALALLVSELENPYAAVGAIDPVNTVRFAFGHPLQMPFDTADVQELALRDPLRFPRELSRKTVILASAEPKAEAARFCAKAPHGRCEVRELRASAADNAQTLIAAW